MVAIPSAAIRFALVDSRPRKTGFVQKGTCSMFKCSFSFLRNAALLAVLASTLGAVAQEAIPADIVDARGHHFVRRSGRMLYEQGVPFRPAGSNNYYPMYVSNFMVDNLFTTARQASFNIMRVWGFIDTGSLDGSGSVDSPHNGIYFHYWDGAEPAFNDGSTGLENLDYVIYEAGKENLKLTIPFVNNWQQFGGMDQYVRWRNGQYHDQFYTDPTIRAWYKAWIYHLLNHTNVYTGIKYKDDATIMTWELANEPRCSGSGVYPQSSACDTNTITGWAADVSQYVKSIDQIHLLSAGDEGWYCIAGSYDWTQDCSQGIDTIALASLPDMDTMSFHLYPDSWGQTPEWGTQWIVQHIEDSHRLGTRAVMGEFGYQEKATRAQVYHRWEDAVLRDDGAGAQYWILSGEEDGGSLYPDYDGFTVYCPSPVCTEFTHFAQSMEGGEPYSNAPPIADELAASTTIGKPVTLNVIAGAVAYGEASLVPSTIDLDPSMPGRQTEFVTAQGTFRLDPTGDGRVVFTPAPGAMGVARATYTVEDSEGRVSAPATITVTVHGPIGLPYIFEGDADR
jgi:mannan endo-1,4-beta-mannosidase